MRKEIQLKINATKSSKSREQVRTEWEAYRHKVDALAQMPISEEEVAHSKKAISSLHAKDLLRKLD